MVFGYNAKLVNKLGVYVILRNIYYYNCYLKIIFVMLFFIANIFLINILIKIINKLSQIIHKFQENLVFIFF